MKNIKVLAITAAIVSLFILLTGCGKSNVQTQTSQKETIKIGAILPLTGPVSSYGNAVSNGIKLAVDEINAKGGVLGKQVEVIYKDDQGDSDKTKAAFEQLASDGNVTSIIGAVTSKSSLAITGEAQAKHIVMISPTSTNDAVTNAGDYIFRACYNDSYQGEVVANFAVNNLKVKRAAVLYDANNTYCKDLSKKFIDTLGTLGAEVVANESYNTGDKDLSTQIKKIKTSNPDVIFVPDYSNVIPDIAKQIKNNGISAPLLGADGWDGVTDNGGDELVGSYYSNHFSADANDPLVKVFVKVYQNKYNSVPNAFAALGYDSFNILAQAIQSAGSTEADKIKDSLKNTNGKFVTGNIRFDENRNPRKSAVMLKIDKGNDGKLTTVYAGTVELK